MGAKGANGPHPKGEVPNNLPRGPKGPKKEEGTTKKTKEREKQKR